ncbi:hypothetical protein BGW80DRAFT_1255932 [Lactifluus volemus]|nr:hypothetical protein BGW80DRAFT_1255932 [Lactifluus volemus]
MSLYFKVSFNKQTKQCYREYYDTTHPNSLKRGELDVKLSQLKQYKLEDVPNINQLHPHLEHEAHMTYNGALLEPSSIFVQDNATIVSICSGCFKNLSKPGESPPHYSLANNLWTWMQQDAMTLQRGMQGTMCTYELNTDSIALMVQENLMPRLPTVLSSTIVITFIGLLAALIWLKHHNTQYYGDVVIDTDRLDNLPVDGIPEEIVSTMRYIADESLIEQESAPYVPLVDDGSADVIYGQEDGNGERVSVAEAQSEDVDIIPLTSNGVFDMNMSRLTATGINT